MTDSWAPTPNVDYSLVRSGSDWVVTQPDDTKLVFEAAAPGTPSRLTSIQYRGGYTQTLAYDANGRNTQVSDNLGRTLIFHYGANGRLDELTDPDGRKIKYTYVEHAGLGSVPNLNGVDVSNVDHIEYVLEKVIYPDNTPGTDADNPTVRYHYEDATFRFALTGITDERGIRYATWSYDSSGRVGSSQHAGGAEALSFAYDDVNNRTAVTNVFGKQAVYHFNRDVPGVSLLTKIEGKVSAHCAAADTDFGYDGNRFVNQLTDGEGRITDLVNDSRGLPTSITRGSGTGSAATTTYTWHATLHVPRQIVEPGLTTDLTWNSAGQLTQATQTDTTMHTMPYPTNGQTRTWTYTYTPTGGLLASVNGPLSGTGDTVSYTYTASGFIQTVTNEVGHVTTFTAWNGRGQPTSMTDPNNVVTTLAYDERGRLTAVTVDPGANQAVTLITYDGPGDITKITRPNGVFLAYTWDDARRLVKVKDNTNAYVEYVRDGLGGITARRVKNSAGTILSSQTATYDELGRLLTSVGAAGQTWTVGYDRTDNLTSVTDPRANVYRQGFDSLSRLISETDEDSAVVTLTRNGKDEITAYEDPRALTTSYVRNGFGEVIQRASPDSGTTVYEYNPLGKPSRITDARGVVTNLTYDNAGRLTYRQFSTLGENIALYWDQTVGGNKGKGRLTRVASQGDTVERKYDNLGRIIQDKKVLQSIQYPVVYSYDGDGNVIEMVYPSGRIVTYGRNSIGRISGVSTKANASSPSVTLASDVAYREFGPMRLLTYGNGLALSRNFTQDYRINISLVREPVTNTMCCGACILMPTASTSPASPRPRPPGATRATATPPPTGWRARPAPGAR